MKTSPSLGCCGLDCGLCPRFYTHGTSRCPGCCGDDFFNKHPSCAFVTCCVSKKGLEVCAECSDFPCARFDRETGMTDSFITHRRVMHNQEFIRKYGIAVFLEQQSRRMNILQTMIGHYDDGKSRSFFCLAAALLSLEGLNAGLTKTEQEVKERAIGKEDLKSRARIARESMEQIAGQENVELKLRKSKK
ncbi:MAG TPA: hypothetical protein DD727_02940 [Clostridiales bacterium]|nr:hypothetical protein [Clostridiales bacterium]